MTGHPGDGRALPPTSRFAGDDGTCDPRLARALGLADPAARLAAVVEVLPEARVLVPVLVRLEERAEPAAPGLPAGEKVASAATVSVAGPDGRAVAPVFSSVASLARWHDVARPVPVDGATAAVGAIAEGDGLLVLDPAGPVTVAVPRPAVWAVAQRRPWIPAPADPEVGAAAIGALAGLPDVLAVRCEPGARAELRVVLGVREGLDRPRLDAVERAAGRALAASAVIAERVDSLEVRVVAHPA